MVKLRAGRRMRKEIGLNEKIDMMRATYSEIKEDLRLMGLEDNPGRNNTSHKKRTFPVKKIITPEEEDTAIEGLVELILTGEEKQEEMPSQLHFQSFLPMIPQRQLRIETKDIDIVKSRNSSVHLRIGYSILAHLFLTQNFST